jgi:hypothetical protein
VARNTVSRSLHDVGLSAWFGGTLANAVALNAAAGQAGDQASRGRTVNAGWDRWTPVNAAAIGAHLIGSIGQLGGNKSRVANQQGVAILKTAVTGAALGVTAYSRVLGKKVSQFDAVPVESGTSPSAATPPDVAKAQKQLSALQWAIPALTGGLVVITSYAGEQQRASEVHKGFLDRFLA